MSKSEILKGYDNTHDLAARRGLYDFTVERPLTEFVLDDLSGFDGMRACDVGCGYGTDAAAIKERFPNAEVFGIDQSQGMIDAAQEKDPRVHFSVGDTRTLPGTEAFDRILVRHVLHLVPDAAQSIDDALSRLAPGGRAVFVLHSNQSQPNFSKWIDWAREQFGVSYVSRSDDFCIETAAHLFTKEGFRTEVKTVDQHIRLSDPEPYVTYMQTQKRWSRPLTTEELEKLCHHVREDINATLASSGTFEEVTRNGVVIMTRS